MPAVRRTKAKAHNCVWGVRDVCARGHGVPCPYCGLRQIQRSRQGCRRYEGRGGALPRLAGPALCDPKCEVIIKSHYR
jgi:hypothetical protein